VGVSEHHQSDEYKKRCSTNREDGEAIKVDVAFVARV
jgi:hypothetical protein